MSRDAATCGVCGRPAQGGDPPLELVLRDGTRVPIVDAMTIGRAPGNTIQIADPTVSRTHARVASGADGMFLFDAGSSSGMFFAGRKVASARLRDGGRIRLGDAVLRVERRRGDGEAGRTIVVPRGASLVVPQVGRSELATPPPAPAAHPKVRSGWALKRLPESEGDRRFVLRDLRGGGFVRMTAEDAALFELVDGTRALQDLVAEAELRAGSAGRARLARLLADLGERGLLEGVDGAAAVQAAPAGTLARAFRTREWTVDSLGPLCEGLYRRGGYVLFTKPALALIGGTAAAGAAAFTFLVVGRYGTPFVVARKIGLGGLVFLGGRFAFVAFHELAHAMTVASFGRRVTRGGLKTLLVFPYVFVVTSEGWFEPRARRIAISAAGPVSDFTLGGAFALGGLAAGAGTLRDVLFNLALAAYVGGFFNLNPALERDGYHILVDVLRQPGLRARSREWLVRRLAGVPPTVAETRTLRLYALATVVWSFSGLFFALVLTHRYYTTLVSLAPRELVIAAFALVYLVALLPAFVLVGRPLAERRRRPTTGIPSAAP